MEKPLYFILVTKINNYQYYTFQSSSLGTHRSVFTAASNKRLLPKNTGAFYKLKKTLQLFVAQIANTQRRLLIEVYLNRCKLIKVKYLCNQSKSKPLVGKLFLYPMQRKLIIEVKTLRSKKIIGLLKQKLFNFRVLLPDFISFR